MIHVVTGASGFLGQHVVRLLVQNGEQVVGVGRKRPASFDDLPVGLFEFISHDLTVASLDWNGLPTDDVETIVHLASAMDPSLRGTRATIAMGVGILENAPNSVRALILASSAYLYGAHAGHRPVEETDPVVPLDGYGSAKLFLENLFRVEATKRDASFVALRFCSIYGPNDPHGKAISRFLDATREGQPPSLKGNILSGRDYLHVSDAACAVYAAIAGARNEKLVEAFNISSSRATSPLELAQLVCAIRGIDFDRPPGPEYDRGDSLIFSSQLAERKLGFKARVDLEAGLRDLAEHS